MDTAPASASVVPRGLCSKTVCSDKRSRNVRSPTKKFRSPIKKTVLETSGPESCTVENFSGSSTVKLSKASSKSHSNNKLDLVLKTCSASGGHVQSSRHSTSKKSAPSDATVSLVPVLCP